MNNPEQHKFEEWLIDQRDNHGLERFSVNCDNQQNEAIINHNIKRILAGEDLTECGICIPDKEYFEDFAEANNMDLSSMADKVIQAIKKKNGNCPCRVAETKCPCPMHREEVKTKGKCTCNLFVKKEK